MGFAALWALPPSSMIYVVCCSRCNFLSFFAAAGSQARVSTVMSSSMSQWMLSYPSRRHGMHLNLPRLPFSDKLQSTCIPIRPPSLQWKRVSVDLSAERLMRLSKSTKYHSLRHQIGVCLTSRDHCHVPELSVVREGLGRVHTSTGYCFHEEVFEQKSEHRQVLPKNGQVLRGLFRQHDCLCRNALASATPTKAPSRNKLPLLLLTLPFARR